MIQKFTGDLGFVQTSGNTQVTTTNVGERYTALRLDYKVDRVFSRRPQTRSAWREAAA